MARAYSVFANGGYRVQPYLIRKIVDDRGNAARAGRTRSAPATKRCACIDPRNAFIMDSMMHDVIALRHRRRAPRALGRNDLAGKTGTTNEFVDAWFAGYQPTLVGIAWIGFDQPQDARQQRDRRRASRCRSGSATWRRR